MTARRIVAVLAAIVLIGGALLVRNAIDDDAEAAAARALVARRLPATRGLPRDARISIDAATTNGRVHTDLPVEGEQPGKRSLKGEVNGGGTTLYLRTTNGGIEINEQ